MGQEQQSGTDVGMVHWQPPMGGAHWIKMYAREARYATETTQIATGGAQTTQTAPSLVAPSCGACLGFTHALGLELPRLSGCLGPATHRSSSVALRSRRLEGGAPLIFFRRSICSAPRLANRRLCAGGAEEQGGVVVEATEKAFAGRGTRPVSRLQMVSRGHAEGQSTCTAPALACMGTHRMLYTLRSWSEAQVRSAFFSLKAGCVPAQRGEQYHHARNP